MTDNLSTKILSDITIFNKYAKYIPELKRRETWEELCERNSEMHIKKYPQLAEEIAEIYEKYVLTKKVLPSMRSMQFAGKPIELANNRIYNCGFCAIDDYRAFSEIMFLLLGGTGMGFSVQKHHVAKLPPVKRPVKTRRFVIGDSIEGWSDAIKVLVSAYLAGKAMPNFDFSDIREKGAILVTSGGKAPGPEPLKDCLHNIQKIFDRKKDGEQLSTLEVHDIVCFIADAVLAGGIRRAALISIFNIDDEDMLTCKYGNWYELNPQRARANNSAVIIRHKVKKSDFMKLWKKIELSGSGEPGFYLNNNAEWGINPSLRKGTRVLTSEGIFPIEELEGKKFIVRNLNGEYSEAKCWLSGKNKSLYKITLEGGKEYFATAQHEWPIWDGEKYVKVRSDKLKSGDKLPINKLNKLFDNKNGDFEEGLILGEKFYNKISSLVWTSSEAFRQGYIMGVFTASEMFSLDCLVKIKNFKAVEDLSDLLGFYGIKTLVIKEQNGSFNLKIADNYSKIHFKNLFPYKINLTSEWLSTLEESKNKNKIEIISAELTNLKEDVWDISVKDETHCFQLSQCISGNCCEISLRPDSFCNLVEVNFSDIESQEDLNGRCKAASFIGTLQAGYTDFHYLRDIWKKTTEKDALLGVSGTGIASGAYLKCNLEEAANVVMEENKRVASIIDINIAARQTCVKPAGTTSLCLGTSSGIHAWFDRYYIRRIKLGKNESLYKYLIKKLPKLIEDDYFKPNLDAFLMIPVAAPEGAIIADEESPIQLLERVKHFSKNWIKPGHIKGDNTHNVSATVYIKDDEWEEVGKWMWENRESYNGLSVLPFNGGTYKQAPHESITKEKYEEMLAYLKEIDLSKVIEDKDETKTSEEIACAGGACEVQY